MLNVGSAYCFFCVILVVQLRQSTGLLEPLAFLYKVSGRLFLYNRIGLFILMFDNQLHCLPFLHICKPRAEECNMDQLLVEVGTSYSCRIFTLSCCKGNTCVASQLSESLVIHLAKSFSTHVCLCYVSLSSMWSLSPCYPSHFSASARCLVVLR